MAGLLAGVRVLDLTNVLAGPFCCYQLAQLGAEVIKVETPGTGDLARQLGADPELNRRLMGASFLAQNAGKRSITLNLKKPKAREAFARLDHHRRRGGREFPARRDGATGAWLRCAQGDQAGPDLLRDLGLRPGRAAAAQSGLRPDRPGPVRRDERHRRRAVGAAPRRLSGRRHHGRHHRGLCDLGRAVPPRAHRRGRVHRRVDAGVDIGGDGLGGVELADRRRASAADGQREHDREPVRHVPHRQGAAQHRGEPAAAVRDAVRPDRASEAGRRSAVRRAGGSQAPSRRVER